MSGFENCVALVTGGASGIGEATVRAIVSREAAMAAAVAKAVDSFGSLTALVNNAGVVGAVGSITDTSVEAYQRTMDIHCKGCFLGMKHAARVMLRGGAIVSLASTAGIIGGQGPHIYTMAKHALVGLTKSAASELATKGIRVNAVAPSGTVTPMVNALGLGDAEATAAALAAASPLGIACMPEDIADSILFLLSDASRHITGQTLAIDAGLTTAGLTPPPFFDEDPQMLLQAGQREQG